MQHNSITLTRPREPVGPLSLLLECVPLSPQEPIEDEHIPRFQPEDGGSGGEYRPVFPPDDGGCGGRDRAPVFEPDENPVGGGSRRPVRPQEPIEDDAFPHLYGPDEPPLGGGLFIYMHGTRFPEDPSGGGEGPLSIVGREPINGGYWPEAPGGGGNDAPILAGPCEGGALGGDGVVATLTLLGPVWPEERDGKGGKVRESLSTYLPGQALSFLLPRFPTERGGTGEGDEDSRYLQEVA